MFFLLGAIVFAIDVANVMAAVAIGVALQEGGTAAGAGTLDKAHGDFIYRADILTINAGGCDAKGGGAAEDGARSGFPKVRVFVVLIVFADVDDRQRPELCKIHYFIERSLAERTFSEKADCDAIGAESLRGESRSGGDAHAATDDCVGSEVAGCGIGHVHRSAFAAAVARFFPEQL